MSRLVDSGRLTLDMLAADVPVFQDGLAAREALPGLSKRATRKRAILLAKVRAGDEAQERLVLAAIPLIKHLASKEYARRQRWRSQVTFEDLFQEGVSGLLRGLAAYKMTVPRKSATNYLGQWILVEMRRNVEAIDNDFGVAFDAAERMRKIRALRSRLTAELERAPTDEEIIEASGDRFYAGGRKLGRVNKKGGPRKKITAAQIEEEREFRGRVGATSRLVAATADGESVSLVDFARPVYGLVEGAGDASTAVVEDATSVAVNRLLAATLDAMRLPVTQREILARRYGMPPYPEGQSIREISTAMGVHRDWVSKVLDAFKAEMTRPGGVFHAECDRVGQDQLVDLGFGWIGSVLGDYRSVPDRDRRRSVDPILMSGIPAKGAKIPPPPDVPEQAIRRGVRAQFGCPYHQMGFVSVYRSVHEIPKERACPSCGRTSRLLRLMRVGGGADTATERQT